MDLTNSERFLRYLAQTSDAPVGFEPVRAQGSYLYDADGNKYLDLISGIAVAHIGHTNPKVVEAVQKQAEQYMHVMVYGEYVESPQVMYAEMLSSLLPLPDAQVMFTNSGTEAVEAALKLAKRYTGRSEVISFAKSYHGSTMGALSAGNMAERKDAFRPLVPDNTILTFNDMQGLDAISEKTACVLLEPVQAEAGVIPAKKEWITALIQKCTQHGVILISDECQTAFGRTGKMFAFEYWSAVPDILVLGKALGGGMPLGACIASKKLMQNFMFDPVLGHLSTFGGHPVSCAAGMAACKVLVEEKYTEQVSAKSDMFIAALQHPAIQVRSAGLLIALECPDENTCLELCRRLRGKHILTDWFLFAPECLRIAPPLIIEEEEINRVCGIILEELRSIL